MTSSKKLLPILAIFLAFSSLTFAVQPDRISGEISSGQMVRLQRGVHPLAQARFDKGAVDPSFRLNYVTMLTTPSASQNKDLARLVAEQQNPKSPTYHKWITPEQYADRFGLSQGDIQRIKNWLNSQGLSIVKVARGRNWIVFGGTAAQIQSALQTELHHFDVNGETHFANVTPPHVPAALSGLTTGFRGLHDFRPKPTGIRRSAGSPFYNSSLFGSLIAPGDVKTIYNIGPVYTAGIDGTGQKLAVMGQTDIFQDDIADFRSGFGLSAISCTKGSTGLITACDTSNFNYVLVGTDPGVASPGDLSEADLDLEWSGATAPNAKIIYVNGETSGGAFDAYYDAIDNNRAPVISLSYGTCERFDAEAGFIDADETELKKGNSEGITIVNSSGDTGAAECDFGSGAIATNGLAIAYPASSPEVTGIGGTLLPSPQSYTSTFFGSSNASDGGTALSYIPETSWNDDTEIANFCNLNPTNGFCTGNDVVDAESAQLAIGMASTGGGISNCTTLNASNVCTGGFPRPLWQQSLVVPSQSGSVRFSPDVSLMASANFPGYIYCTQLSELQMSGTGSACAPGGASGIVNGIADFSIVGGTSVSAPVFAGMVVLLNQYLGGSGLGNINPTLYALAVTSPDAFHHVNVGTNKVYCTPGTPAGQPAPIICPAAVAPASHGIFGYDSANKDATTSYNLVTGLGSVDVNNLAIAWAASLSPFSLTPTDRTITVNPGGSGSTTITAAGFSSAVTFSCVKPAALTEATCTVTSTGDSTATVNITTTAATSQLRTPIVRGSHFWYAALLPGLLGMFFAAGSKRAPRGLRRLSLIIVLGVSTLWMGACGGSGSGGGGGGGNPGTPAGNYSLSINGTTGGSSPETAATTVTLTVN